MPTRSRTARLAHNSYPGSHDDPGRHRPFSGDGFLVWITDGGAATERERPYHCGWLGKEHFGTVRVIEGAR